METSDQSFFDLIDEWLKEIPRFIEEKKDYIKIHHDPGSSSMDAFTSELSINIEDIADDAFTAVKKIYGDEFYPFHTFHNQCGSINLNP